MRFPEFKGEWKTALLGDILTFKNGLNCEAEKYGKGIKSISVSDVLQLEPITYSSVRNSVEATEQQKEEFKVSYGDVLFQRSSETPEDIGQSNVYLDQQPCVFGGFVIRGKAIKSFNPLFFKYLMKTQSARREVIKRGAGAQHYNIGQGQLSSVSIKMPTKEEQRKISAVLQLIDKRIEVQRKTIEDINALMVWARNEFFDSRACNKTKVKLGSMYRRGKAGGTPKTTEPTYYDGTIPFLSISDMTLQGKYITKTSNHISEFGLSASAAWIVPPNSLIVSMYASVGLSAINRIPLATSQAMYSMVFDGELTVEYVYQFLCYFRTKKLPALLETGTQSNINADDIRNIQVPEIDTQSRLFVNKMSSFEQLAEVEKSALIYLFELKQYLLLNLFA